ncbi:hypothetical protein DRP05_04590 [Archaeoglobales archaeon]|nr:MAG: hypothetical protein DRO97_08455 [Archaeoglobales archaeon]RLI79257.1 MAG: hypothetical protein DRP05_04590 [Archaeoglobales archaeon]
MPRIGGKTIPVLIHGTSPFIGAGQFGSKSKEYYNRFYKNPELMAKFFICFAEKCYPCLHILPYPSLLKALDLAMNVMQFDVIVTVESEDEIDVVAKYTPIVIFLHASTTDEMKKEKLTNFLRVCEEFGSVPGAATHCLGKVIPYLEEVGGFEAYMTPINPFGLYMEPSFYTTIKAIESVKEDKVVFGMKTLAAGRIDAYKGFQFALSYAHSLVVGFTEFEQIDKACRVIRWICDR